MQFSSYAFIFLYLPLLLLTWHLIGRLRSPKASEVFIVAVSCIFYGMLGLPCLLLLIVLCIMNYLLSCLITGSDDTVSKLALFLGILLDILVLAFYKYAGLLAPERFGSVAVPVGLSFYTFSQIAYLADRYKGRGSKCTFLEYAAFVTYFPKLSEGPIALCGEVVDGLRTHGKRPFDTGEFTEGLILFIIGLSKKVLLADILTGMVNYGYEVTYYLNTICALIVTGGYILSLYFDFSGYCDMACGISLMMGISLPANFLSPFKAVNMKIFWQKWHITLSRFLTRYVYIPLGGNRKGVFITILNTMIVFLISGIWHGSTVNFLIWGFLQGIFVVISSCGLFVFKGEEGKRYLLRRPSKILLPRFLGQFCTFWFYAFSFIFFRAPDLSYAAEMIRELFTVRESHFIVYLAQHMQLSVLYPVRALIDLKYPAMSENFDVLCMFLFLAASVFLLTRKNSFELAAEGLLDAGGSVRKSRCIFFGFLFFVSVISLGQVTTYLYFAF